MAEGWFGDHRYYNHLASTPQQGHGNEASRAAFPRSLWDELTALYPEHLPDAQQHYTESPVSFNYQHLQQESPAGHQSQWAASPGFYSNYQNRQRHESSGLSLHYPEPRESGDPGVEEGEEEEEETTVANSVHGGTPEQTPSQAPEQTIKKRKHVRKDMTAFYQLVADYELRGHVVDRAPTLATRLLLINCLPDVAGAARARARCLNWSRIRSSCR